MLRSLIASWFRFWLRLIRLTEIYLFRSFAPPSHAAFLFFTRGFVLPTRCLVGNRSCGNRSGVFRFVRLSSGHCDFR